MLRLSGFEAVATLIEQIQYNAFSGSRCPGVARVAAFGGRGWDSANFAVGS